MKILFSLLKKQSHTSRRLAVLVWLVSTLLLAFTGLSALHLRTQQASSERLLSMNVASIRSAVELETQIQEVRHRLDRYLWSLDGSRNHAEHLHELRLIRTHKAQIHTSIHDLEVTAYTTEEKNLIQRLRTGLVEFYECFDQIEVEERSRAEQELLVERSESILENGVLSPARRYLIVNEELLELSHRDAEHQTNRLVQILLICGVAGTIVAMSTGYSLARRIHRSLLQLHIPMRDVAGKLSEVAGEIVVSTSLDLTDLRPALSRVAEEVSSVVEQLQSRHQEILHAEQLSTAGQLAAGMAHEIRNPLMSMKMIVQANRLHHTDGIEGRDLEILDEEIRRLETLLNEFLEFARPRPLHKTHCDLGELVEQTLSFLQRQASARNLTLQYHPLPDPVIVYVDSARIRQVILNLSLNALEASPANGIVHLSIDQSESDTNYCALHVRDEGPGISTENEDRIFEPFFSTKETGLGLGLVVSRRIIESHGGKLYLNSVDSGCEFVVRLPIGVPSAATIYCNKEHVG